jgi:hypothetical protein
MAQPTKHIFINTFKSFMGMDTGYTAQDSRILYCLNSATSTIENLLGHTLSYGTYTETMNTRRNFNVGYDMYGTNHYGYTLYGKHDVYKTKNYPIDMTAPITITYTPWAQYLEDETPQTLDTTQYAIYPDIGVFSVYVILTANFNALTISYSAGYQPEEDPNNAGDIALEPNLPGDLVQAALFQAQHVYSKQSTSNINVDGPTNTSKGSRQKYVNHAAISPEAMAIIVQRRRMKIGVV